MIPRIYQRIVTRFRDVYGPKGEVKLFFAPGRITFMGEHTDYNGGSVLSAAVERGTYIVGRKRNDSKVSVYAASAKSKKSFTFDNIEFDGDDMWLKCIKSVFNTLLKKEYKLSGMDIYLYGDLSYHSSLASSSSLCACCLLAVLSMNNIEMPSVLELAKLSYEAETSNASHKTSLHTHVTILASKKSHLTLFNTKTQEISHVAFDFNDYSLVYIHREVFCTSSVSVSSHATIVLFSFLSMKAPGRKKKTL